MATEYVLRDLVERCEKALGRRMTTAEKVELLMDNLRVIQDAGYARELIEKYSL